MLHNLWAAPAVWNGLEAPETNIKDTAVLTLRTKGHRPEQLGKSLLGHRLIQQRDLNAPRDGWPVLCHEDYSRSKAEYDPDLM